MDIDKGHMESHTPITNDAYVFLRTKAERIATGVYLVSGILPDGEPMKVKLRASGLALLEATTLHGRTGNVKILLDFISALCSLLRVARGARLLSDMNISVLMGALEGLASGVEDLIKTEEQKIHQTAFLSENILGEPREEIHTKEKDMSDRKLKKSIERPINSHDRKSDILAIVHSKGHATVSDIKQFIKDISDKTIQRDLSALVAEGRVRKEGDRRWAKYFAR